MRQITQLLAKLALIAPAFAGMISVSAQLNAQQNPPPARTPQRLPQPTGPGFQNTKSAQLPPTTPGNIIVVEDARLSLVKKVDIPAQAEGLITEITVEEGEFVAADSLIAKLDERTVVAELEVAKQEAAASQMEADDDSRIRFAKSNEAVSTAEYKKYQDLYARNSISESELNKKRLEEEKGRLSVEVEQLEREKNIRKALVATEKVRAASVQVELRQIKAPFDGVVSRRLREPNSWARSGEAILQLVSMSELRVEGNARGLNRIAPHMLQNAPVRIAVKVAPEMEPVLLEGKIDFVSPLVTSEGAVRVWTKVANQQIDGQWLFRDGMKAEMQIILPLNNVPPVSR